MKIAVIGAGAMGSIYAGFMAKAGHEVYAVDTWVQHVEAICRDGLHIDGPGGKKIIKNICAKKKISDIDQCELYVISTKSKDVEAAAAEIQTHMGSNSIILAIQNGIGSIQCVKKYIPTDHVFVGVADGFGASVIKPGHVHHHAMNLIRVGELNGGITSQLEGVTKIWELAGFNVKAFKNIEQLVWEKFIC